MVIERFDSSIRALIHAPSRREVLRGLAGVSLGFGAARFPDLADAKKKKRKHKKPKPNAYGCLEVGDACKDADQCCSGICEGKTGRKRCRAHGAGTCNPGSPGFCSADDPTQALCNDSLNCVCLETTGGSAFCGSLAARASGCADCKRDADCLALGAPPGSACVPFATGACAGACESGMLCVAPCHVAPFVPEQRQAKPVTRPLKHPIEGEG